jgi:hypothetical protein
VPVRRTAPQQLAEQTPMGRRGVVVTHAPSLMARHERATQAEIARRLAVLLGHDFAGEHDPEREQAGPVFVLPDDTLVGLETARQLGISSEQDLFGGVVPHRFLARPRGQS